MNVLSLVIQKLKAFRMPIPPMIMLAIAAYRSVTSGDSILIVGLCAAIVPFICQFRNFPKNEDVPVVLDVLSNYLLNLILTAAYIMLMMIFAWAGKTFNPNYVVNPHFLEMTLLSVCGDLVFVSAVIPVCRDMTPMQRLLPPLVLVNGLLGFLIIASDWIKTAALRNLPLITCGFCALILVITFSLIVIGYGERKAK